VIASDHNARPILRWVGGKRYLREALINHCPHEARSRTYFEPFLGAASLFFALRPTRAVLGDANKHLISAYDYVRRDPTAVARNLRALAAEDSTSTYYRVRDDYNRSDPSAVQTARFIYLNRTCFNGIFRVNKLGAFNVPYGHKAQPWFPGSSDLRAISGLLKAAELHAGDYRETLETADHCAFVYLDPPYPALNGTSNFTHYTMDRFNTANQHELASHVRELDARGCLVMVSNADTPLIRELYSGFDISELSVTRYVTCKAVKHRVGELVITNYRVDRGPLSMPGRRS
jgi:DNA adenine methylase